MRSKNKGQWHCALFISTLCNREFVNQIPHRLLIISTHNSQHKNIYSKIALRNIQKYRIIYRHILYTINICLIIEMKSYYSIHTQNTIHIYFLMVKLGQCTPFIFANLTQLRCKTCYSEPLSVKKIRRSLIYII